MARNGQRADMNLELPVQDARRIEGVCKGLPLWHGEQFAVDALAGTASPELTDVHPGIFIALATRLEHPKPRS